MTNNATALETAEPSEPPGPAALEVRGLFAGYDRTEVLRDVSITVPRSSVVALVGPNGAGKSTLIKTVAGLLPVTKGEIVMFGEDVTRAAPERRATEYLCTVPEGRGIYRSLTVRENLRLQSPPGREAISIERATAAFPRLGERLGQQAGTLSGGEQQMLSLAAAYIRDPALVVIDEASLGLAPVIVDLVFEFVSRLRQEGAAMLVVDQFVHRVLAIADNAYVLTRGAIAYDGPPEQLLADDDLIERYLGTGAG